MGGDRITRLQEEQRRIWEAEQRCPVPTVFCSYRIIPSSGNLLGCKRYDLDTAPTDCLKYKRAVSGQEISGRMD